MEGDHQNPDIKDSPISNHINKQICLITPHTYIQKKNAGYTLGNSMQFKHVHEEVFNTK
jgi:hypothetical protein